MALSLVQKTTNGFQSRYQTRPVMVVRSPGRVNIIGEHTDYNMGFVLPAAIDKAVYIAISPRIDEKVMLYSSGFNEYFETSVNEMKPVDKGWPNYILGVADQLVKRQKRLTGFQVVIDGDVPIGSGLSSSAAVECAMVFALDKIFDLGISREEMVFIAQKAEHEFAGVRCGIMDQFASMFGKKDHAIKLDCRSLQFEYIPLSLSGYAILLFNTNVKHALADSAYNERRSQCERGLDLVKQHHQEVKSLRDVTMGMLTEIVLPVDPIVFRRCSYVVQENQRLLHACEDLKAGDIIALGKKMFDTHEGLSKEYEVSCRELDYLVESVRNHPGVAGARMMGGGFGGCTINLVKENSVEELVKEISVKYENQTGIQLSHYIARTDDGCRIAEEGR